MDQRLEGRAQGSSLAAPAERESDPVVTGSSTPRYWRARVAGHPGGV